MPYKNIMEPCRDLGSGLTPRSETHCVEELPCYEHKDLDGLRI